MTLSLWFAWHIAGVLIVQSLIAVSVYCLIKARVAHTLHHTGIWKDVEGHEIGDG